MALPAKVREHLTVAARLRAKGEYKRAAARLKQAHEELNKHREARMLAWSKEMTEVIDGGRAIRAEIALIKEAAEK